MFESTRNTAVLPVAVTPKKTIFGLSSLGMSSRRRTELYFFMLLPLPKRRSVVYVKSVVFVSPVVFPVLPVPVPVVPVPVLGSVPVVAPPPLVSVGVPELLVEFSPVLLVPVSLPVLLAAGVVLLAGVAAAAVGSNGSR